MRYPAASSGGIIPEEIETVLTDDRVEPVIEAIIESTYTGEIGDGKIFLYKADDAIRKRNRDRGEGAL